MKRGTAIEVRFREKLAKRNKWTYLTCFEVLWAFGNAHATFQKKLLNNEHVVPNVTVVLWAKPLAGAAKPTVAVLAKPASAAGKTGE